MVNQGLIKLDDPIEKYLPSNIKVPQYKGHKITIEDLATHTSGLPNWPSNYCPPKKFDELYQKLYIQ
jgi:CubicO group peptidase (beta-lactamase class C family)